MGLAVDMLSILRLKKLFTNADVDGEIEELSTQVGDAENDPICRKLASINLALWMLESEVRNYDERFLRYAQGIFELNEVRSEVKRQIDMQYHQNSSEMKTYENTRDKNT